jgi:hypothetical protein
VRGRDTQPLRGGDRGLFGGARRQRPFHRMPHELVDRAGIAKAHFALLRMDIHVDAPRVELEP